MDYCMSGNNVNELQAARLFLQVLQAGSFVNASRVNGVNPSTLTRTLADLERHLGTQLLNRTTRRLRLTEAGRLYQQYAEAMLATQAEAHEALGLLSGGIPRGKLRVTMPIVVGERLLGPALGDFHARYPGVHLELEVSDRLIPLVQAGFDLALRVGRLPDSSLRAHRLGDVKLVMVASPAFVARYGAPRHPADLAALPCLVQRQLGGPATWGFFQEGRQVSCQIGGWLATTSATLVMQQALAGLGIARISEWVAQDALADGRLVQVLPDWGCHDPRVEGVGLHAVYAQGAGVDIPLKSRVFVDFVQELVREQGGRRALSLAP
jgi:DNA-binding transcriptional LysR family regulator